MSETLFEAKYKSPNGLMVNTKRRRFGGSHCARCVRIPFTESDDARNHVPDVLALPAEIWRAASVSAPPDFRCGAQPRVSVEQFRAK